MKTYKEFLTEVIKTVSDSIYDFIEQKYKTLSIEGIHWDAYSNYPLIIVVVGPDKDIVKMADNVVKKFGKNHGFGEYTTKHAGNKETAIFFKKKKLNEKWNKKDVVNPDERGKYKGWSLDKLKKELVKLRKSGPHPKGSKEYNTMMELIFAIRAKTGWGNVDI